mgnify:CR=1 FL=1
MAGTHLATCSGELYPLVAVINNNIIKAAACSLPGPASDTPELFHVHAMDEGGGQMSTHCRRATGTKASAQSSAADLNIL